MKPLAVTPGDPAGIGPEVACKALVQRPQLDTVLIGDGDAIRAAADVVGLRLTEVDRVADVRGACLLVPTGTEAVEVSAIRVGTAACLASDARALVTGPIHKARLSRTGFSYPGHTDFLGHLCGVEHPVMAFVGGDLKVALVTVHVPLRDVADRLTTSSIAHVVRQVHEASRQWLGLERPRIAVCGLNPHAGDEGLLGREDLDVVAPAVEALVAEGIDARGPVSSEAAFRQAARNGVDWVVAMYHDQGLAPLKLVDFGRSVNWTLGLPIVRTSVDHGTADDIAGHGIADPRSMVAALDLAHQLTR